MYFRSQQCEQLSIRGSYREKFGIPLSPPIPEFKHEELYQDQNGAVYAKMLVEWNGMYEEPEIPFPKNLNLPEILNLAFGFLRSY